MKPKPGLDLYDLARLYALEHICRCLWQEMTVRMANEAGVSYLTAARDLAQGLDSTLVDSGQLPPAFQRMVRDACKSFAEETLANARNLDDMKGS